MLIFGKTDRGCVRTDNQDACFAGETESGAALAVVCDGMGGANAGSLASTLAVKLITDYVNRSCPSAENAEEAEAVLRNALVSANITLYDKSVSAPELNGMGTTAAAVLTCGNEAAIAHVGDSRVYLINDGIHQLTRDHSVVQSLIESGKITPEAARVHPRKNVITRALGAEEEVTVDSTVIPFNEGETLLLCSDGLTNFLEDREIYRVFSENDISDVAERLVERANENGGGDNITVVTVTNRRQKG